MKPVHAVPLNEIPKQCSAKHRLSQKENGIGTISHQFICVNLVKSWDLKNCDKNGTIFNYISQLILIVTAVMLIFRTPHSTAIQRQFMWKLSSHTKKWLTKTTCRWTYEQQLPDLGKQMLLWSSVQLLLFLLSCTEICESLGLQTPPMGKGCRLTILCFKINQSNTWASQVVRGSKKTWIALSDMCDLTLQSIAYNNSLSIWETLQEFIWNFVRNRYLSLIFSYLFLFCRLR